MNTRTQKMFQNLRIDLNSNKKSIGGNQTETEDFSSDDSVKDPTFSDGLIELSQNNLFSSTSDSGTTSTSKKRKKYTKRIHKKKQARPLTLIEEAVPTLSNQIEMQLISPDLINLEIEKSKHIPVTQICNEEITVQLEEPEINESDLTQELGERSNYLEDNNAANPKPSKITKSSSSSSSSSSNSSSGSSSSSYSSSSSESDDNTIQDDHTSTTKNLSQVTNTTFLYDFEKHNNIQDRSCNSISESDDNTDALLVRSSVKKSIIPSFVESSSPLSNNVVEYTSPNYDTQGNENTEHFVNEHRSIVPYDASSSDDENIAPHNVNMSDNYFNEPQPSTSSTAENIDTSLKILTRKRRADPDNWIRNTAKRLRNTGQSYTSTSKRTIPERSIKPPCSEKCKHKCSFEITEIQRRMLFSNYWGMGDLQRQREYILRHISSVKPRYSYKVHDSNRGLNSAFYLTVDQKRIRVCKKFFKATLDITDRAIKTVRNKAETENECNILSLDKRGKHQNGKCIDPEIRESVREHINSIPRIESHYCRADSKRQYIEGGKSISDLHRDYVEDRKKKNLPYANYLMYNRIFNFEYNISFMKPKKDQCEDCASYANATEEEKTKLKDKIDTHLNEKLLSRSEKDNDKKYTPDNCIVSVYDLQATMPCPRGDVSTFYYISKLNVFNFTICDIKNNDVSCFVWHEGEGKRGVNEIGTCLMKYIESLRSKADELQSKLDLIFYSDNCCGQQKNHFMIALYVYAVKHFEYINSITHKFLIKGHTQNEGDNVHSVIERQIQKALKSGPIYSPDQYFQIIRNAKKTGKPYRVTEMSHVDFVDIKNLAIILGKNYTKNTENQAVKITEVKKIKVDDEYNDETHKNCFCYKTSYLESEEYKKVSIDIAKTTKRNPRNANNISDYTLRRLYQQKIPVAEQKKKGILGLIKKNIVPRFYTSFYENL